MFGYKQKQVRDNIHSHDVVQFIAEFIKAPRVASVYNIGGGKENSISMMEAFSLIESISEKPMKTEYAETARAGDHIVYYSDLRRAQADYPNWNITKDLPTIFKEIYESWEKGHST